MVKLPIQDWYRKRRAYIRGAMSVRRERLLRILGRALLWSTTYAARVYLRKNGPLTLLVDSTVLAHGITHETAWISTGTKKWGDVDIDTGYAARIPVHAMNSSTKAYAQTRYLPGIAYLARLGLLQLVTSAELQAEQFRQPIGRFNGYGYYDLSVFRGIQIKSVDGVVLDLQDAKETQLQRVASCTDPLFLKLLATLGPKKSSLDAYHLHTAEKHGLYGFLHVDFPLAGKFRQQGHKQPLAGLKTRCLLPSQLAKVLKLLPMQTWALSYEDSSFPVRPDLHWDKEERMRPRRT